MELALKAELKTRMQQFLDDYADEIGAKHDIWQDDSHAEENATLMANAAEVVFDAMELQSKLEKRFNPMK